MVKTLESKTNLVNTFLELTYLKILKTNILFKSKDVIKYVSSMELASDSVEGSYKSFVKNAEMC